MSCVDHISVSCSVSVGNVETTSDEMAKLIFDCLKKQAKEVSSAGEAERRLRRLYQCNGHTDRRKHSD